jgi:hypothetical protein
MRTPLRFFALTTTLIISACTRGTADPVRTPNARTVASMLPKLSRALTPATADAAFGRPDETTGSGLLIYVYRVEEGKNVYLGFPGYAKILYAHVIDSSGSSQDLPFTD